MTDAPILVISDVHLGFESESSDRFQNFMGYLTDWVNAGETTIRGIKEPLKAPQKVILLGDFIDLWISRDSNTARPFWESYTAVNSLIALERNVVYICGNHDGIMNKYAPPNPLPPRVGSFTVADRYPPKGKDGKWHGEQIGALSYHFLHGHQFDLVQHNHSVLRLGNFLGLTSASAGGFWEFKTLGKVLFILIVLIVLSPLVINWLPLFLARVSVNTTLEQGGYAALVLFLSWIVGAFAFLGVLWVLGAITRWYYNKFLHPKHDPTKKPSLFEKIRRFIGTGLFSREARKICADTVVFGHVHHPEMRACNEKNVKLRINCGSWIAQKDDYDTFVYIDENKPYLLRWQNDPSPGCVTELRPEMDAGCLPPSA